MLSLGVPWTVCPHRYGFLAVFLCYAQPLFIVHSFTDPVTQVATDQTRKLGLVVVRGTQVSLVSPQDGVEEIANPFLADGDDEEE